MADTVKRKLRPIRIKQQESITPVNLERIFTHLDNENDKLYQILGENGVINSKTVVNQIISGGGAGGITVSTFIQLADTPTDYSAKKGIAPSVNSVEGKLEFTGLNVHRELLPSGDSFIIQNGYQMIIGDQFDVQGILTVDGSLLVFDDH